MLFNSLGFLLVFLPASLTLHTAVIRLRPDWRPGLLVALSFVFYGWWDLRFTILLAASIVINWLFAEAYLRTEHRSFINIAVAFDLFVLALFKYLGFLAGLVLSLTGVDVAVSSQFELALPLGISFFTFQHIMYLFDLRAGRANRTSLVGYALYVAFFPRLLAGPLVRWSELAPQFVKQLGGQPYDAERTARGLMLLAVGLSKKVYLGDPLSAIASPVFAAAAAGQIPTTSDAWGAVLAYTFQIYFDFSGYTDMALGTALLFGVILPQNFDAPYRATSLQDFWRRWHISLSHFLRDYLYIPMGGSRHGLARQLLALTATMTLGGLWHGAGLTFVVWGVVHGLGLGVVLLWQRGGMWISPVLGWLLTFVFVMMTWVLFRAPSFEVALVIYGSLIGLAPVGTGFDPSLILAAAAISILGPTSWSLVSALRPVRLAALGLGAGLAAILLAITNDNNYDFIYLQF
jgi:D-alanyl-lipoteichoic acid acyltransferase DltB (MBOAT superfamily)